MTKLLNKYKEIKRTKKGFTLVELLVVIAILAVLASVSVVGYLGFTTKARNSNAMTELAQVREVIRAELIDGDEYEVTVGDSYTATYQYKDGKYYFTFAAVEATEDETTEDTGETTKTEYTYKEVFEASFSDLAGLGGTYYITLDTVETNNTGTTSTATKATIGTQYTISKIGYATAAKGYALWTIDGDKLETSTKETVEAGSSVCYEVAKSGNNEEVGAQ